MATFNRSFGNNTPVTKADDNETPNTKKEEAKTGVEVGAGVGDSARVEKDTVKKAEDQKVPSGVNKEVWAEAERQLGVQAGLDDDAKEKAIQARYDSMVASDKQVKDWAGGDKEILGDV